MWELSCRSRNKVREGKKGRWSSKGNHAKEEMKTEMKKKECNKESGSKTDFHFRWHLASPRRATYTYSRWTVWNQWEVTANQVLKFRNLNI